MSTCVEDLQMLRLIKAFQKLKDPEAQRSVVLYAEEQAEKEGRKSSKRARMKRNVRRDRPPAIQAAGLPAGKPLSPS